MAQQFMGGGVVADEGQGVRENGQLLAQMGNTFANIAQQLTAQKNMSLIAAEQARKDFFDTAEKLGIPPQAYASSPEGKAQYQLMIDYQNKALNAGKLLGSFGKPERYQDSAQAAQQFVDFNNLTPEAIMHMSLADQTRQNAMQAGTSVDQAPQATPAQPQVTAPDYAEAWAEQAGKPKPGTQAAPMPNAQAVAPQAQTVPVKTPQAAPVQPAKSAQPVDYTKVSASTLIQPLAPDQNGITREVINPITGKSTYYKNDADALKGVDNIMSSNQFKSMPDKVKQDLFARYQAASTQVSEVPGVTHQWTYTVDGKTQLADTKAKAIKALADNPKFQPLQTTQPGDNAPQSPQGAKPTKVTIGDAQVKPNTQSGQIADPAVDAQFRQAFNTYAQSDPSMKRVAQKYSGGMTSTEIWNHAPETFKSQWISQNGTLPPGVTLGNNPRADAAIAHNMLRVEASAEVATAKAEPVKTALESGTTPNPKDTLTFRNALAQCGNNYAQALRAVPESTRNAINKAVMKQFMEMDSTQAELAGMHEVASRKEKQVDQSIDMDRNAIQRDALAFQKEDLQARLAMAQMEAMTKLSTAKFDNLKTIFGLLGEMDKTLTDKTIALSNQYKGDTIKMYRDNPDLVNEKNMLTSFKQTVLQSAGFDTKQMDFSKVEIDPGWGIFHWGQGIKTTPLAESQENDLLSQARADNAKSQTTVMKTSSGKLNKVMSMIK